MPKGRPSFGQCAAKGGPDPSSGPVSFPGPTFWWSWGVVAGPGGPNRGKTLIHPQAWRAAAFSRART
eukprot:9151133-Pyramimonas_sp.AAC.1